jgi:hypothetical protein
MGFTFYQLDNSSNLPSISGRIMVWQRKFSLLILPDLRPKSPAQASRVSNSKSEISNTTKEHDFVVFFQTVHEFTNVGSQIRAFVTYLWMVGGSNRQVLRLLGLDLELLPDLGVS